MAENNEKAPPLRYIRGLFKDTSHIDQPQGTVRFARNAILNQTLLAISTEEGNELKASLPAGSIVIGTISLTDNRIVIFSKSGNRSEVGIYQNTVYTTLLNPVVTGAPVDTDMKFSLDNPIEGTYTEQADGDLMIYWTDDLNPPRALNVTRQQESNVTFLYGVDPTTSPDSFYIDLLNLFPHSGPTPHVELNSVDMGGECKTGVYYLALAYTDADFTTTNFVTIANPVSIVEDVEGVLPLESYDGAPPESQSGKSIKWTISNINRDYKYLTSAVVFDIGKGKQARKMPDTEILDRDSFDIVFSGDQNSELISLEDVTVDTVSYTKAKTINQLDGVLYLGNLASTKDLGYQKYANFITTTPVLKTFDPFDPFALTAANLDNKQDNIYNRIDQGYRDAENIFKYKGYTREEVYALYIAFILKNGEMSYAYHIPGRAPLEDVAITEVPELHYTDTDGVSIPLAPSITAVNEVSTLYYGGSTNWHIMNITGGSLTPISHFFQWYDFSEATNSNNMNYWHNLNEFYPDTENYDIVNAQDPNTIVDTLRTLNVRHHRFPSNRNVQYTTVKDTNAEEVASSALDYTVKTWYWYWVDTADHEFNSSSLSGINPNFTLEGVWTGGTACIDGIEADEWMAEGPGGGMMDAGWDGTNNLCEESNRSCYPPNNSYFLDDINCLDCNADEMGFEYTTHLPSPGTTIYFGWNDVDINPLINSGCSTIGAAEVGAVPNSTTLWVDSNYHNQTTALPCVAHGRRGWPTAAAGGKGGWVAWAECRTLARIGEDAKLEHEVQALGFKLSDLKIPKSIADQVQGFKIYYADRTYENRTVLGQNPIHPMDTRKGANIAGCSGEVNDSSIQDSTEYFLPLGLPVYTTPTSEWRHEAWSFHDFYLLNRTPSLATATHIKLQYKLRMLQFKGNAKYYWDAQTTTLGEEPEDVDIYSCVEPRVWTAFFASGRHNTIQFKLLNYTIRDKAKTYVLGDTFAEVKPLGFKYPIYNIRGETHIGLSFHRIPPYLASGKEADWRGDSYVHPQQNNSGSSFTGYSNDSEEGLELYMANLKAFKTDVYNAIDTQDLVWTGYEIVGDDLDKFTLDENNNPTLPLSIGNFSTDEIFGGDTFICRHGYRMTSNEQINNALFDPIVNDIKSVMFTIVESTENINFRHIENESSLYFPGASLYDMLKAKANVDFTYNPDPETGNMRYNEAYSQVNNIKGVLPLPFQFIESSEFPTRVIRSETLQGGNLINNFRRFQADQSRTLEKGRGELWKIITMESLLLFHMEDTLFKTKGKQTMKVDANSSAYIGSGDLFAQVPDELRTTDHGYLGTRAQRAALVTPYGYFSVDVLNRRIFFIGGGGVQDLTSSVYGMQRWFQRNIPFALEEYGFNGLADNPITGMGFHAIWDERYGRVLLTKRDIKPTSNFIEAYSGDFESTEDAFLSGATGVIWIKDSYYRLITSGGLQYWEAFDIDPDSNIAAIGRYFEYTGWTISFTVSKSQTQIGAWSSFHDYVPYIYSSANIDIYSFVQGISSTVDVGIYKHGNNDAIGKFYGTIYPFEVEIVHNIGNDVSKLFYSLNWLADILSYSSGDLRQIKDLNAGFTSFMVYNSDANSGEIPIEYLINTRKTGGSWKVNQFRDMSLEVADSSIYYTGPFSGSNYGIVNTTVAGTAPSSVLTATPLAMFNVDGMYETFNTAYLDTTKPWNKRGKFIDRFLAFRLISNNLDNNLINLYNTEALYRIQPR